MAPGSTWLRLPLRPLLAAAASLALGCAEAGQGKNLDAGRFGEGGAAQDAAPPNDGSGAKDFAIPPDFGCLVPLQGEFCPPLVYVSTAGSDFNAGDSPAMALRTVPVAIAHALRCSPCPIVIAGGTYSAQVVLRDGLTIFGGYTQDFRSRDLVGSEVILTADDPRAVVADGLIQPTTVDGVTIQGATLMSQDGRSSYALWAHGTRQSLKLTHVKILAGRGADGARGAPGGDLACGTTGASGGVSFDCGGSSGAFGTAAGDPVSGGAAGTGGNSNCPSACPLVNSDGISDGSAGGAGNPGAAGASGIPALASPGSFTAGMWSGPAGAAGMRGLNGTGGGGGGSGGTKRIRACFGCGTLPGGRGGDGAIGGCGGGGGGPGGAGGGSFAVLLDDADVSVDGATIAGGTGGAGGAGGDGKDGQPGGANVRNGIQGAASATCGLINYSSGGGGPGGPGGSGGAGGGGAGGAGGAAIAVARVGNSTLEMGGSVAIMAGTAGAGGRGGASAGKPGGVGPAGVAATDQKF